MNFKHIRVKAFALLLCITVGVTPVPRASEIAKDVAVGAVAGALPTAFLFTQLQDLVSACNDHDPIGDEGLLAVGALTCIAGLPLIQVNAAETLQSKHMRVLGSLLGVELTAMAMIFYRQYQARKKYEAEKTLVESEFSPTTQEIAS